MKTLKKLFAVLLVLALLAAIAAPAVSAEDYTYTVRVFAGAQGTIGGQEVVIHENIPYGAWINLSMDRDAVILNNSTKYYVKGIRESGKDNNTVSVPYFRVTEDTDYVIAYGILGSSVAYTVNYVDIEGNALLESITYYGNVGDKPVLSYQYIDGYQPQAYNLTKTLSENAAENVFTFIYTSLATPTPAPTPAPNAGTDNGNDTETSPEPSATPEPEATPNPDEDNGLVDIPDDALADQSPNNTGASVIPESDTPVAGPVPLQDLDDGETPLGNYLNQNQGSDLNDDGTPGSGWFGFGGSQGNVSNATQLSLPVIVGACAAGLTLAGLGAWFLIVFLKRKKRKTDE